MATYMAVARSNYFTVKDLPAFVGEATRYGLCVKHPTSDDQQHQGLVMIHPEDGGWPGFIWDEEDADGNPLDFDAAAWVATHLIEGSVAVLQEVGFEKLRYLVGYAVAVNSAGETRRVSLDDLGEQAQELGRQVTEVSY